MEDLPAYRYLSLIWKTGVVVRELKVARNRIKDKSILGEIIIVCIIIILKNKLYLSLLNLISTKTIKIAENPIIKP